MTNVLIGVTIGGYLWLTVFTAIMLVKRDNEKYESTAEILRGKRGSTAGDWFAGIITGLLWPILAVVAYIDLWKGEKGEK